MITLSSKEVRAAALYRGCNEVDEVDRPQPGGAGCGHCFYPTCVDARLSRPKIAGQLSAVIELSNLTGERKNSSHFNHG